MAGRWQRGLWASLFLAASLSAGCNLMALPFFLMPGMEPKNEAKCKLASANKEEVVKVVVLASAGLETRPEFVRVDRDLAGLLTRKLEEGYKNNKEKVVLVPNSQIERYKDKHPEWRTTAPEEIGAYFDAKYVISIEINSISLYEPGSFNIMFKGHAEISINVTKLGKNDDGPIYQEEYTCEYPRSSGPVPAGDSNTAQFRQRFLQVIARDLSWRFLTHPLEDEQRQMN
jgi:hypothetical protein